MCAPAEKWCMTVWVCVCVHIVPWDCLPIYFRFTPKVPGTGSRSSTSLAQMKWLLEAEWMNVLSHSIVKRIIVFPIHTSVWIKTHRFTLQYGMVWYGIFFHLSCCTCPWWGCHCFSIIQHYNTDGKLSIALILMSKIPNPPCPCTFQA